MANTEYVLINLLYLLLQAGDLRITVGNDKFRERSDDQRSGHLRPGLSTDIYEADRQALHRREEEQYRREAELYGRVGDSERHDRYRSRDYDRHDSYERDPYRRLEEREHGDRRGLGANSDYSPRLSESQSISRSEHIFPSASRHALPAQPVSGTAKPLKSILKKKSEPPPPSEKAAPKPSGLPGISNYIDDIEDEDKFLYGDDNRKDSSSFRDIQREPQGPDMRSAAQAWQPSAPEKTISEALSSLISNQREYVDNQQQYRETAPYQQQQLPATGGEGDLWSMLAKSVQTAQQQQQLQQLQQQQQQQQQFQQLIPQNQFAASTQQSFSAPPVVQDTYPAPVADTAKAPGTGHDPTIENILKSIGFDFEMSRRMQEKAKQGGVEHVQPKQPSADEAQFGIKENASFIGSGMSQADLRSQLAPDASHNKKQSELEHDDRQADEKKLERGCSPVSEEGTPPPVFNLPPITIKRRHNLERRSPGWDRDKRSPSRSPERIDRHKKSRSPSWTRSVSSAGGKGRSPPRTSHSGGRQRSVSPRRRSPSPRQRLSGSYQRSPSPRRRSPSPRRKSPSLGSAPERQFSPVITRTFNLDGLFSIKRRSGGRSRSRSPRRKRSRSPRRSRSPGGRRSPRRRSPSPRGRRRSYSPESRGRKRGHSRSRSRERDKKSRRSSSRDRYGRRRSSSRDRRRSRSRDRRRSVSVSSDSDVDGPANKEYFSSPLRLPRNKPPQNMQGPPQDFSVPPPGLPVFAGPPAGFSLGPPPGMPPMVGQPPFLAAPAMNVPMSVPGFGFPPPGAPLTYSVPPPAMPPPGMPAMQSDELAPPGTTEMPLKIPARTVHITKSDESRKDRSPVREHSSRERSERKRSRSRSRDREKRRDSREKSRERERRQDSRERSTERDRNRDSSRDRERKRSSQDVDRIDSTSKSSRIVLPPKSTRSKEDDRDTKISSSASERVVVVGGKMPTSSKGSKKPDNEREKAKVQREKESLDKKMKALEVEFNNLKQQEFDLKQKTGKDGKPSPILIENNKLLDEIKRELTKLKKQRQELISKHKTLLGSEKDDQVTPKTEEGSKTGGKSSSKETKDEV